MSKSQNAKYSGDLCRELRQPVGSISVDRQTDGRIIYSMPCSGGSSGDAHAAKFETANIWATEIFRRQLTQRGWSVSKKHLTCPDCNERDAQEKADQAAREKETDEMAAQAANDTQPTPTPDARRMRRQVMQWLDEAYDTDKGRYRSGFSDDTIAKETRAAAALVKQLREEFYGDAGEPPEVSEIRDMIDSTRRSLQRANKTIADQILAMEGTIKLLRKDMEHNAVTCETKVKEATDKLEQLAAKNGWAQ